MGWEDRDYNRDDEADGATSGRGWLHRVFRALNASIPLGTYLGIRVRLHVSFLILLFLELIFEPSIAWTLRLAGLLFVSVLLHEFGHCLACRWVGGEADEILMWPLGGLAFCSPPRRPGAHFITAAGGPLVTLFLTLVPLGVLTLVYHAYSYVGINPEALFADGAMAGGLGLLRDIYLLNYVLLLFNLLLAFYPFDGGRLVQAVLWKLAGYQRSMRWATALGMAGAGALLVVGAMMLSPMLVLIAIFGFFASYQEGQIALREAAGGPDYDPGYYNQARPASRPGMIARWRRRRLAQRALRHEQDLRREEAHVDAILAKVKASGMASLSDAEKKSLQRATERYQKSR